MAVTSTPIAKAATATNPQQVSRLRTDAPSDAGTTDAGTITDAGIEEDASTCAIDPAITCEGKCGSVTDGCGAVQDCGPCDTDAGTTEDAGDTDAGIEGCGNIDKTGVCEGNLLKFCYNNVIMTEDCAAEGAARSEVELELSGWPLASCDYYSGNNF